MTGSQPGRWGLGGAWSRPKASWRTDTARITSASPTTQEIRMAEVEII